MLLNCSYAKLDNFEHFKTFSGGGAFFRGHNVVLVVCGVLCAKVVGATSSECFLVFTNASRAP